MSRVCQITGKAPMVGNNVSHANNKLEDGTSKKIKIAASTLRTIRKNSR